LLSSLAAYKNKHTTRQKQSDSWTNDSLCYSFDEFICKQCGSVHFLTFSKDKRKWKRCRDIKQQ